MTLCWDCKRSNEACRCGEIRAQLPCPEPYCVQDVAASGFVRSGDEIPLRGTDGRYRIDAKQIESLWWWQERQEVIAAGWQDRMARVRVLGR